jgi:hypothetical protein
MKIVTMTLLKARKIIWLRGKGGICDETCGSFKNAISDHMCDERAGRANGKVQSLQGRSDAAWKRKKLCTFLYGAEKSD